MSTAPGPRLPALPHPAFAGNGAEPWHDAAAGPGTAVLQILPRGTIGYIPEQDRYGARSVLTLAVDCARLIAANEAIAARPADAAVRARVSRMFAVEPSRLSAMVIETLQASGGMIEASMDDQRAPGPKGFDDLLYRLLAAAIWPSLLAEDRASPAGDPPPDARLSLMQDYIEAHIRKPITISALARAAGISTRLVHHLFLRQHGMGPAQWIRNARLDRARAALLEPASDRRIRHIASDCGFAKPGLFSSAYRERFGETPRETRFRTCTPEVPAGKVRAPR